MSRAIILAVTLAAAVAGPQTTPVRGQVVDEAGAGLSGVTVFALDAQVGSITARVVAGDQGRFVVSVPRHRRHRFEAEGSAWTLVRFERVGPGQIRMVMRKQPGPAPSGRGELVVAPRAAHPGADPAPETIGGRVIDETGAGARGVRLSLVDQRGRTVAVADSGARSPPRSSQARMRCWCSRLACACSQWTRPGPSAGR